MERDNFGEVSFALLTALTAFMTCNEVCENDKNLIKVNRFKKFVNSIIDDVESKQNSATGANGVIDFSNTPNPEDNSNY